ncbi:MAG: hypothetical protein GXP53_08695 [Deltaproteobacteria bacterium]|nr:hypothetical protein [Deltaproteobacteria bacterium]
MSDVENNPATTETKQTPDTAAIDQAVAHINHLVETTVEYGAITIGDYVLDTFFDGDIELAAARNSQKSVSYRMLSDHPDLMVKKSALNVMVRVAAQERFLKAADIDTKNLKYRHKSDLLRLANTDQKIELALQCMAEDLTTRELADRITNIKMLLAGTPAPAAQVIDYVRRVARRIGGMEVPEAVYNLEAVGSMPEKDRDSLAVKTAAILENIENVRASILYLRQGIGIEEPGEGEGIGEVGEPGEDGEPAVSPGSSYEGTP